MTATEPFPHCTSDTCNVDEDEKKKMVSRPPCALADKCVSACSAYGKVCPCAARVASQYACDAMHELMEDSLIFTTAPDFHHFDAEHISIEEKLGEGGFSNVNRCIVKTGDEAGQEFAIKYLKRKAMVDLHTFKHGAADLAVEAYFLQTLHHPNIVTLHGVSAGSVETNVASGRECGFFIVVDRLVETLEEKLEKFRADNPTNKSTIWNRLSSDQRETKRSELRERIDIALAIASAMEYLHASNIVFRDLKPDNIGFDKNGTLKIFDFGLAKELKPGSKRADGRYQLTGNTGSRRYMAPEVAKESPYNKSVDVYSFGILLWELCTGEKPFYGYSSGKHMQQVVIGGERPPMDAQHTSFWPNNLQWLIKHCWHNSPCLRPSFTVIKQTLLDILADKDSIPVDLLETSEEESGEDEPKGVFSSLLHIPRTPKSTRAKSTEDNKSFKLSKPERGRSKTWGFLGR